MIDATDLKRGLCFEFKGSPVIVIDVTFSTPTARGSGTIAKTKLRNLVTGQLLTESLRSGEKYPPVEVERRPASYLYTDGELWYFMEGETFEQFELRADDLGDAAQFLLEGLEGIQSMKVNGKLVNVELPATVALEVVEADPVMKGATAKAQYKRAVVSTGAEVKVPGYVDVGQVIRIDTRDGHFVERVQG
jgi:elongation factor P